MFNVDMLQWTFSCCMSAETSCEAVGGLMTAEDYSLAPVPSPVCPSLCKPGVLPSSLSNHSAQPRGAGTKEKEVKINSEQRREGERGRKHPGNLVDREIGKEWQNPNRLQSCDWKNCFSWAGEKGRGHVFKDAQAGLRLLGRKDCAQVKMHLFSSNWNVFLAVILNFVGSCALLKT